VRQTIYGRVANTLLKRLTVLGGVAGALHRKKGALKDHGKVYFMDAAHLVHNAVPGRGWIKRSMTVELKTNSSRNRLNVLGAYSPDDHTLEAIEGTGSCDAELVCHLLRQLRAANPGQRLLVVLDNARYQRARRVRAVARRLGMRLLFLPLYSPKLNLIECFWKFLRKKIVRTTYYATFADFRGAIQRLLANLSCYADELTTLMTENFHLFGKTG
jgi:transposase